MDERTLSMEVFVKSLTKEQADMCESDENQLADIFMSGWTEENALEFHRTMLLARRLDPAVTVAGVFDTAFRVGLSCVVPALARVRGKTPKKRGVRVVGVPGNTHGRAGVSIREA